MIDRFLNAASVEEREASLADLAAKIDADRTFAVATAAHDSALRGLVGALKEGTVPCQVAASQALRVLAKRSAASKDAIRDLGALPLLVALLEKDSVATSAAHALANLAVENHANKEAIRDAGGLVGLIAVLERAAAPAAAPAAGGGGPDGLLATQAQERVAQAIDALCQGHSANQEAVMLAGGAVPLLAILSVRDGAGNATPAARLRAAFATYRLASNPSNLRALVIARARDVLAHALADHRFEQSFSEADGVVAAAAAMALLPGAAARSGSDVACRGQERAQQVVVESLAAKLTSDDPRRAMRLRDFTLAARALAAQTASPVDFARQFSPVFVSALRKGEFALDQWTPSAHAVLDAAAGTSPEAQNRNLCLGDVAGAVMQLAFDKDARDVLLEAGAWGALEALRDEADPRLSEAVCGALHLLSGGAASPGRRRPSTRRRSRPAWASPEPREKPTKGAAAGAFVGDGGGSGDDAGGDEQPSCDDAGGDGGEAPAEASNFFPNPKVLPGEKSYHVFLSHKQTDAKDFARALHTMFTLRGYRAFLDMEYAGDLATLGDIVERSLIFAFILTDNALESPWCIHELEAAVAHGIPVIIIKKEGARWADPDTGLRSLAFPSYAQLKRLPDVVRGAFQIKILEHSDTYYSAFVEKLFDRLAELGLPMTASEADPRNTPEQRAASPVTPGAAGQAPRQRSIAFTAPQDTTRTAAQPRCPSDAAGRQFLLQRAACAAVGNPGAQQPRRRRLEWSEGTYLSGSKTPSLNCSETAPETAEHEIQEAPSTAPSFDDLLRTITSLVALVDEVKAPRREAPAHSVVFWCGACAACAVAAAVAATLATLAAVAAGAHPGNCV
ncbi:armadillo-type protein [Pelagophyceae sp. CCMP2097]|nr:armadillo-type protein [Pelagophyceae sp. CCMP2097]